QEECVAVYHRRGGGRARRRARASVIYAERRGETRSHDRLPPYIAQVLRDRLASELCVEQRAGVMEGEVPRDDLRIPAGNAAYRGPRGAVPTMGASEAPEYSHNVLRSGARSHQELVSGAEPSLRYLGTQKSIERGVEPYLLAFPVEGENRSW